NHFSNWIMSRSEISLASRFRDVKASEFKSADEMRKYIIVNTNAVRKWRQKGVVTQFKSHNFDADIMEFAKIGNGSLGGKARSLAFMSAMLNKNTKLHEKYPEIIIGIPRTLVISTDGFESFISLNRLQNFAKNDYPDSEITENFLKAELPDWLLKNIVTYLALVKYPLSVRSSSLLEDSQFLPYAGIYQTYMIPNNHSDFSRRVLHLTTAVKLVYASTYYESAKAFSRRTSSKPQEESMAVVIQQLIGEEYGDYFYPAVSGVVQSHNFYPVSKMKPEEGIAHIALGLGKTVVEGERTLRFSPKYPNLLPQFSTVDDILANSQKFFYALKIRNYPDELSFLQCSNLERREIHDADGEYPVKILAGTYVPGEHRIRDTGYMPGPKVITFDRILKHGEFPLPELLSDMLELGRKGMGCPVEIEFSVNLGRIKSGKAISFFCR
ncbi:MAG: phosphoenolpyruvate synthase/pyruvate phosphate dikinase, partial [Desulfobacteraceae bacterium]